MKNLRISRFLFFIVLLILLFLMFFVFILNNSSFFNAVTSPVRLVVTKVDSLISAPFRVISTFSESVDDLLNTYEENETLKEQIAEMEDQSSLVTSLQEENKELNAAIDSSVSSTISVVSKVTVRTPVSWYDSLTLGIGKKSGISKNMLVLSDGGLVGIISAVTTSSSTVDLLSSGDEFDVPVKISTDSGEIYGLLKSYDTEDNCFVVSDLNSSDSISEGASVVTSGLDGKSVANISVGTVSAVKEADDSLEREVYVTPKADFSDISYVTVVGD